MIDDNRDTDDAPRSLKDDYEDLRLTTIFMRTIRIFSKDEKLLRAARSGHTEKVVALLKAGANIHMQDDNPLRIAALYGRVSTVKALIAAGADVHARCDYALRVAAGCGHAEIVQALLEAGADAHANNNQALEIAKSREYDLTVGILQKARGKVIYFDGPRSTLSSDEDRSIRRRRGPGR